MRLEHCLLAVLIPAAVLAALPRGALSTQRPAFSVLKDVKRYEVVSVDSGHFLQEVTKVTVLAKNAPANATVPPPETRSRWLSKLGMHPHSTEFNVKAFGIRFGVKLTKNTGLFAPGYTEEEQVWKDGQLVSKTSKPMTPDRDCLYHGYVENNHGEDSFAGVSTCRGGFRGILVAHGDTWNIDLATSHLSEQEVHDHQATMGVKELGALHVMWRLSDHKQQTFSCAVTDHDVSQAPHHSWMSNEDISGTPSAQFARTNDGQSHAHVHEKSERTEPASDAMRDSLSHDPLHLHRLNDFFQNLAPSNPSSSGRSSSRWQTLAVDQKYVEMYIVNDLSRYNSFKERVSDPLQAGMAAALDSAEIVNIASGLYVKTEFALDIRVNVSLVGQATWTDADPYTITPGDCSADENCKATEVSVNKLLSHWNAWRSNIAIAHDDGHLFSALDFAGPALGYAGVGVMCQRPQSGGIGQMGYSADNPAMSLALNAAVFAHELGHNFDMKHDSQMNDCEKSGWIMNAVVDSSAAPNKFSTCSVGYFNNFMKDGLITCLDNVPTARWGDPICGNGFIEPGEECDCPNNDCSVFDPCCFNCTLAKNIPGPNGPYNAECSSQEACCDSTCKIVAASTKTVCRAAKSFCDIEETCTGESSKCPTDLAKGAGTPCSEDAYGAGACLNGQCLSLNWQCRTLGAGFSGGPFDACPAETQAFLNNGEFCQSMWCSNGPGSCTTFRVSTNIQLVYDGVPCAKNKQCYHQSCVDSEDLNPNFQWAKTDWESCTDCEAMVNRNVTCRDRRDKTVVVEERPILDNAYCSPTAMPLPQQKCNNKSAGCISIFGGADGNTLDFFGYQIQRNTLMFGSLGAVSLFLVVLAICYQAVTWGGDELIKEREAQRQKEKEHLDDIEHDKRSEYSTA